jgi:hypothetical protein
MAWIFLRSGNLPSIDIVDPSIIPENVIKTHLFGFKLIPNSLDF